MLFTDFLENGKWKMEKARGNALTGFIQAFPTPYTKYQIINTKE